MPPDDPPADTPPTPAAVEPLRVPVIFDVAAAAADAADAPDVPPADTPPAVPPPADTPPAVPPPADTPPAEQPPAEQPPPDTPPATPDGPTRTAGQPDPGDVFERLRSGELSPEDFYDSVVADRGPTGHDLI